VNAASARSALTHFNTVLRRAAAGDPERAWLVDPTGRRPPVAVHPTDWSGPLRPGDGSLLARCVGATLDLGCGPGRLAAHLAHRGTTVLGIDVSTEAVRQARRRGAPARLACALTGDVGTRWRHILLADGNIGIGGHPTRLLARCRELLREHGDVLAELEPPGRRSWAGQVALSHAGGASAPFDWAAVAIDDIATIAGAAGLAATETWTEAGRWFTRLVAC
jgi:SAM-dependent methyltransferase